MSSPLPPPPPPGGVPGIGKTQLCMQLALDVSLGRVFGGVEGSCIYIDTEGSLIPGRIMQMATAICAHIQGVANVSGHK